MITWEITIRCTDDDHLSEETFTVSVDPNVPPTPYDRRCIQLRLLQKLIQRGYLPGWMHP